MDTTLQRLKTGVRQFQRDVYPKEEIAYRKAASEPQQPHTLMITCADSRIDIETITQAKPGELFTLRNIGNIVPVFGAALGGVSAVVEYAVSCLHVKHVVICGHSDCGAMKALRNPDSLSDLPTVALWVRHAEAAKSAAESLAPKDMMTCLTEQNVLLQLQQLKTHPSVADAMAHSALTVSGWIYDIGTGGVRIAEDNQRVFAPV